MACEGCTQKLIAQQNIKTDEEAKDLANRTGQWVAIYKDESGAEKYILSDLAGQYPVIRRVSPDLSNNTNRTTV